MNAYFLFLEVCRDLEARGREASAYSALKVAALVRQLLLDATPLVHVVNRTLRLKISFEVCCLPVFPANVPKPDALFLLDGLDALDAANDASLTRRTVNLDQFLSHPVAVIDSHDYSVKDAIGFLANVWGGVHLNQAQTHAEKKLASLNSMVSIAGYPPLLRTIRSIATVTLRGLGPLRTAAEEAEAAIPAPDFQLDFDTPSGPILDTGQTAGRHKVDP